MLRLLQAGILGWAAWRWWQARQNGPQAWPIARSWETRERAVWLTIDDGPGRRETEAMVDVLAEAGMRATFFFIGRAVEQRRGLVLQVRNAGQSVGLHSYAHRSGSFWAEPGWSVGADLRRAEHVLRVAGGLRRKDPVWYRAPAGRWSGAQMAHCAAQGWHPVGWTVAAGDGLCRGNARREMDRLLAGVRPGAILLMHQGGRGKSERVVALRYLVHRLQQEGWQAVVPGADALRFSFSHSLRRAGNAK